MVKKVISRVISPVLRKFGYIKTSQKKNNPIIDSYTKNKLLFDLFTNIIKSGLDIKHIVDVGANRGTWTREALKYFPNAHYTLLEPQYWLKESFNDILSSNPKVNYFAMGAGKTSGKFNFTIVDRDDSCSFRFSEAQAKERGFEQVELPVITLDKLIRENGLPVPDLIKIDAEGLDLEVLDGAKSVFGKTEVILVEAGVGNKNFTNDFKTVLDYMDNQDYRLFDITDLNRPFQRPILWLVELAFIKKGGLIDSFDFRNS